MLSLIRENLYHPSVIRIAGLLLLAPGSALAAPFCVTTEAIPMQCIYVDPQSCNKRATQLNGWCTTNPAEQRKPSGVGAYCVVTAGAIPSCIYADRGNCDAEARHQNGVCIIAPIASETPGADPYRNIRPQNGG
jgi:hypothetical protein